MTTLSAAELRRYGRHLVMPEVGLAGQERLRAGRVLLVGAGGLGSPAALYLAAAGVGTLGIVEFDVVDETNLHRQILFGTSDVGRSKLEVAQARLAEINPHVTVAAHAARLDLDNALALVAAYDLVVDGSDNFPTRYLVNDACVLAGRPDVWGAVYRFEGQASIFGTREGPCYRCLFPEPPPPGLVPSCAEAGVFGVLPGIVGSLQAAEVIKWLAGLGEPLVGKLLVFDALTTAFRTVAIPKNPDCPLCSAQPTQNGLVRYDDVCAPAEAAGASTESVDEIAPVELARRLAAGERLTLLDVRSASELALAQLPDARWIPLQELPARLGELPRDRPVVAFCHVGGRSAVAADFLRRQGFPQVLNLAGGIDSWSRTVDRGVPRY